MIAPSWYPEEELDPRERLESFINFCRSKLEVFGAINWDDDSWDVSSTITYSGRVCKVSIRFYSLSETENWTHAMPMTALIADFAKGFVRYRYGQKPTRNIVGYAMFALRSLERAMHEEGCLALCALNASVFDTAVRIAKQHWPTTAYITGQWLEEIAVFLVERGLTSAQFKWRNSIARSGNLHDRTGPEAERRRQQMMPDERALQALADAFCTSHDELDVLVTSTAALLLASPSRINEIVSISVGAERTRRSETGTDYGLQWSGSKGAQPSIKWITPTMIDITRLAFVKIKELSEESRRIALWYELNPKQMYLPPDMEHLRGCQTIDLADVEDLLGSYAGGGTAILRSLGVSYAVGNKTGRGVEPKKSTVRFQDLEEKVLQQLPRGFPIRDKRDGLRYSQSLFLVPFKFFRKTRRSRVMFEPVTMDHILTQLGSPKTKKAEFSSIFGRLGVWGDDGKLLQIRTHQFRHWLNTIARQGGLGEVEIARWSGRRDIRQNEAYDHLTATQMLEMVRNCMGDKDERVPAVKVNPPVTRVQVSAGEFPTAHETEFGVCVHDWVMSPCSKHRDCLNCNEQYCVKGDKVRNSRVRSQYVAAKERLSAAQKAHAEGCAGADRWLDHYSLTVERLEQLVGLLDDPRVPPGSVIWLRTTKEFSPVGVAVHDYLETTGGELGRLLTSLPGPTGVCAVARLPRGDQPGAAA